MTERRHRRWPWVAAGVAVLLVAFVLVWFQPHKLLLDDHVDEAIPVVAEDTAAATVEPADSAAEAPPATVAGTEPFEVARGEFVSLDHGTTGVARILELADGTRIVRLDGLDTDNGPDLYVYLSTNPTTGDEGGFDDDVVNLGRLKGNLGDQNYDVATDVDLSRYASVVIWCDRFNSAFGAAQLVPT